jgi:Ca2+/Na+ antiporter
MWEILVSFLEKGFNQSSLGGCLGGPVDCWLHVCGVSGVSGVERQINGASEENGVSSVTVERRVDG